MATTEVRARSPYPTPYPAPADPPMDYKMYIGGEWVESESGERFDVFSPGDGSLIGSVPKGTAKDAQRAIDGGQEGAEGDGQALHPGARQADGEGERDRDAAPGARRPRPLP